MDLLAIPGHVMRRAHQILMKGWASAEHKGLKAYGGDV